MLEIAISLLASNFWLENKSGFVFFDKTARLVACRDQNSIYYFRLAHAKPCLHTMAVLSDFEVKTPITRTRENNIFMDSKNTGFSSNIDSETWRKS